MNKNPITGIAITSLKTLLIHLSKLFFILFSWGLKFISMFLNQVALTIEKIIVKKSS
jgi:hypothetical protein